VVYPFRQVHSFRCFHSFVGSHISAFNFLQGFRCEVSNGRDEVVASVRPTGPRF
jgi:hypothetical protein